MSNDELMPEHPAITALRATVPHTLSPHSMDRQQPAHPGRPRARGAQQLPAARGIRTRHRRRQRRAALAGRAGRAAEAQVAAAREAVTEWPEARHHRAFCGSLEIRPYGPRHACNCGVDKQNGHRMTARRALGLEE